MPRFASISVYPTTVMWGAPWSEDPDVDAFSRLARGVCEVYSEVLSAADLQHTVSSLVLHTHDDPPMPPGTIDEGQTVVASPVDPAPVRAFFEAASVRVVPGFADLAPALQLQVVIDAVHAAGTGLARYRGLPVEPFDAARSAVGRAAPEFAWSTSWLPSPDGRWQARCCFRTLPDGFGRQVLEVSSLGGSRSIFSPERVASATRADQRRAGAGLRWTRGGRLQVPLCSEYRGARVERLAMKPASGPDGELTAPGSFDSLADAAVQGPTTPAADHRPAARATPPRSDVLLLLPDRA